MSKIANLFVKVGTDRFQVLIPIRTAKSIDTIIFEMEETIGIDVVAIALIDSARVDSSKGEQVVSEELILHLGQSVEHLNCAL